MPGLEINDVAKYGVVRDTPSYMVPPEAWSLGLNMHVVDGGVERISGWTTTFGTPTIAPHFLMPVRTLDLTFWLYMSLTKAAVWDGTTHTDVTRVSGDYNADGTEFINGTTLGGIPILNNGTDIPQFWAPQTVATKLQDLTNWPAGLKVKVLRAFGPFLIGFNCTKGTDHFQHMIKWSHEADPGALPPSWDETDATIDAGEVELSDANAGIILDALPLNEIMYVYKENSTWKMRFVGGRFIFSVGQAAWLQTGLLCARAVAITGDGKKHVVATQDDIIWHDGNTVRSVLTLLQRRRLFNELDADSFATSFMWDNPITRHMFFCYPTQGSSYPDKALVMYYGGDDNWPVFEMDGVTFRNAAVGPVEGAAEDEWPDDELEWEGDDEPWSQLIRRKVIAVGTDDTMFFLVDSGSTRNGVEYEGILQRTALAVTGKKRDGSWIVDWDQKKMFDELWPKIQGIEVMIRYGFQDLVDGPITWYPEVSFVPGTDAVAYPGPVSGRAGAIEFSSSSFFRLDGYKINVISLGNF